MYTMIVQLQYTTSLLQSHAFFGKEVIFYAEKTSDNAESEQLRNDKEAVRESPPAVHGGRESEDKR